MTEGTNPFLFAQRPLVRAAVLCISIYQKTFSLLIGGECRFYPTCSEYARLALQKDGLFKGAVKAVWRILRCHQFNKGGIDFP